MRCPFCGHEDSQVKDSRPTEDGAAIRRRRQCEGCAARFTTFERIQLRDLVVVKSDDKREPFDREKLLRSLSIAARKRPIDAVRIEKLVSGIQRRLETQGEGEVSSKRIGEMVMEGLRALDPVAYIRFASVYRDFSEARDFEEFAGSVEEAGEGVSAPPPLFVLVRPQLAENIGKAARAMLNFGLTEMRLVSPRDGWPNPAAGPAASGADVVLANAQVYDSVAAAVADCTHVFATTVRRRGVTKPVLTPEAAARAIYAEPGRSALLFGPERSGLETDDVALARTIVTVPINPEFGSLNLAQAVILLAYEWSKGANLTQPPALDLPDVAPQGELDGMIDQLDAMLDAANFFFPPDRTLATKRTLRTLLTKPGWSSQEIRTLRGVLSALDGAKARRR